MFKSHDIVSSSLISYFLQLTNREKRNRDSHQKILNENLKSGVNLMSWQNNLRFKLGKIFRFQGESVTC